MDNYNSESEIKLRRFRSNLASGGRSYIIFGLWSVVKLLLLTVWGEDGVEPALEELAVELEVSKGFIILVTVIVMLLIFAIIMIVHVVVGLNAIRFSKGKNNKKRFYIFTVITTLITLLGFAQYSGNITSGVTKVDELFIASVVVDASMAFILIDMVYSAIMIGKLEKNNLKEEVA